MKKLEIPSVEQIKNGMVNVLHPVLAQTARDSTTNIGCILDAVACAQRDMWVQLQEYIEHLEGLIEERGIPPRKGSKIRRKKAFWAP